MLNPHKRCQETRRLLEQGARLVDVRTPDEYLGGALKGAINHPVQWMAAGDLPEDKSTPVVVYCVSGQRSRMAKQVLQAAGFEHVHDLGGYQNIQAC